jgi:hypothetical protein
MLTNPILAQNVTGQASKAAVSDSVHRWNMTMIDNSLL